MGESLWWQVGQVIIVLGGVVGAIGILGKSPFIGGPMRWIGRTMFLDPIGRWFDTVIRSATEELEGKVDKIDKELHPNGGSTFRDDVQRVGAEFHAFAKESQADRKAIHARVSQLHEHIEEIKRDPYDSLNDVAGRIGRIQKGLPETKEP